MNSKKSPAIRPEDAAKGASAETAFRQWLDASELAHVYLDQSTLTVPEHLRGQMKRPDYLVGYGTGSVAFDVKAKTTYPEGLIFDLSEVRRLRTFARKFHMVVFFACLDPEGGRDGYWVRLDQLDFLPLERRGGKQVVCCPTKLAMPFSMEWSFHDALSDALTRI